MRIARQYRRPTGCGTVALHSLPDVRPRRIASAMADEPTHGGGRRVRPRHQALRRADQGQGRRGPTPGAVNDLSLVVPAGKICVPRRAVRLRQDDLAQDGQPAHRADVRPDPHRRRRRRDARRDRPAPEHRLRHPAGRAVPAPDDRRERGHRAAPAGLAQGAPAARSEELLGLVGLDPAKYRDRFPSQLSGGERQRVGVARALAADPPIMLMDEPFGAVDPIVRDRLQNEFLRLQETIAKTILFVTHDIDEAIKMGDLVAVFQIGGILAQFGPPPDILADAGLRVRGPLRRRRTAASSACRCCGSATSTLQPAIDRARRRLGRPRPARRAAESPASYVLVVDDGSKPDRVGGRPRTSRRTARSRRTMANPVSPIRRSPHDPQGRAVDDARRRRPDRRRRRSRRAAVQGIMTDRGGRPTRCATASTRRPSSIARLAGDARTGPAPTRRSMPAPSRPGGRRSGPEMPPGRRSSTSAGCSTHLDEIAHAARPAPRADHLPAAHRDRGRRSCSRSGPSAGRRVYGPITAVTGVLYTIPSLAAFAILRPIFGLSLLTAIIPLTTYTLLILFRNITAGFQRSRRDPRGGRGDGLHPPRAAACASSCRWPSR